MSANLLIIIVVLPHKKKKVLVFSTTGVEKSSFMVGSYWPGGKKNDPATAYPFFEQTRTANLTETAHFVVSVVLLLGHTTEDPLCRIPEVKMVNIANHPRSERP